MNGVFDRRTVDRLYRRADRMGLNGRLMARVFRDRRGDTVIEVRSGRFTMAEVYDYNHDRRADLVLLARF